MTPEQVVDVVTRARDLLDAQKILIDDLRAKNASLSGALELMMRYGRAVELHNAKCAEDCNDGHNCGWAGFLKRTGRRCGQCPAVFKIDPMPTKGSA